MNGFSSVAAMATLALAACTAEPSSRSDGDDHETDLLADTPEKHFLVNSLVDSFSAPACLDAKLRRAMRREGQNGIYHLREFSAPRACIEDLKTSFRTVNFSELKPDFYVGELSDGNEERVIFKIDPDDAVGIIEWEVDVE